MNILSTKARRRSARHRPIWTKLTTFIYVPAVVLLIADGVGHNDVWLPWKMVAAVVLVATLVIHVLLGYRRPMERSRKKPEIRQLDAARAYSLQRRAGKNKAITGQQARAFFFSVVFPQQVRKRLVERYRPNQRTLTRTVFIDGQVPAMAQGRNAKTLETWLVPIAVPLKGRLFDNFEIDNGGGEPVATLSYSEYLEVAACVIRTMLMAAYGVVGGEALPSKVERAEHIALIDLMQRGVPKELPGIGALTSLSSPGSDLYEPPTNQIWLNWTIALVERLATRFAVVARLDSDAQGNYVIRYIETRIPPLNVSEGTGIFARTRGMMRLLLGARPINLDIPLHLAGTCQSYHLYVHSEESLYLGQQTCLGEPASTELEQYVGHKSGNDDAIPPYYRFRTRLGQSYAHFYARYFPSPSNGQKVPIISFAFYEKPPGSNFRAAIASIVCFLLVWLVGYVSIYATDPKTDAPAFLLVVPALAAALLGFESRSGRLLEGTLAARLSLITTAVVSLGASGLYLIDWTDINLLQQPLPGGLKILWLGRWAWGALLVASLLNALSIGFTYLVRAWEFSYLAARAGAMDD